MTRLAFYSHCCESLEQNMLGKIDIDHSKIKQEGREKPLGASSFFSHTPLPRIKPPSPPPPSRCHSRLEKHTF